MQIVNEPLERLKVIESYSRHFKYQIFMDFVSLIC